MSEIASTFAAAWLALSTASPLPLSVGLAAYLLGVFAVGARLHAAAGSNVPGLSRTVAAAIGLSSVFASHVSFGAAAGELARLAWLRRFRRARAQAPALVAVLAIDRVADGVAIAALVGVALVGGLPRRGPLWLAFAPLVIAATALFILARPRHGLQPAELVASSLAAIPAALAAWILDLVRVGAIARAVGLPLSVGQIAVLAVAALVGGQAPTPGGLGAVEGAMGAAGLLLGLSPGPLVALVVAERTVTLGLGTAGGALAGVWLLRKEVTT